MAGAMKNVRPHSAPTMPENSIQPHIDAPMLRTLNAPTTSNTPNTMKNAPMNHASAPADTSGFTKNRMPRHDVQRAVGQRPPRQVHGPAEAEVVDDVEDARHQKRRAGDSP